MRRKGKQTFACLEREVEFTASSRLILRPSLPSAGSRGSRSDQTDQNEDEDDADTDSDPGEDPRRQRFDDGFRRSCRCRRQNEEK